METARPQSDKRTADAASKWAPIGHLTVDAIDLRLLGLLLTDGRASFRKMAEDLKVSTTTVASHVAKLEKERVITDYAAVVDFQKLGYELTVITEILVSKGKLLEMEKEIAKVQGVCAVYDVTGEIDGIVVAKFKNREQLSHFTKSLLAMPFVERTNSHVVLTTVKEDFRVNI
jgi:DNA-binding Lrp family transcriptional regulator